MASGPASPIPITFRPIPRSTSGVSRDFNILAANKPTTFRFDIVNLFDTIYEIRDGSGIGVFAPQFGPRRGFFAGITQKL